MQKTVRSLLALPLLLALGACGGEAPIEPTLGLDGPATLTVAPGASLRHDLSLQRNETADGPVTLTIEGLPQGVTARFEPATVAGDALETTLLLEAARDAARGVSLVTVRANGGEALIAERMLALEVRGITVEGRLLSAMGNAPPPSTPVIVDGQTLSTDVSGRFTAHDVALPYDLVVMGQEATEIFLDATHPSPTIRGMMMWPREESEAFIVGTVSPLPEPGEEIVVCASVAEGGFSPTCETAWVEDGAAHFELSVYLATRHTTADVQVVARRVVNEVDAPLRFSGYAEQMARVGAQSTAEVTLALQSAASTLIELELPQVEGAEESSLPMSWVSFGDSLVMAPFDLSEPRLSVPEDGVVFVMALATTPTHQYGVLHRVGGPEDGSIHFSSAAPTLVSPEADAAIEPDTEFVASGTSGGVTSHLFESSAGSLVVHTTRERFTMADLPRYGNLPEPGNLSNWMLFHTTTVAEMDEALAAPFGPAQFFAMATMSVGVTAPERSAAFVVPAPRTLNSTGQPVSLPPVLQPLLK